MDCEPVSEQKGNIYAYVDTSYPAKDGETQPYRSRWCKTHNNGKLLKHIFPEVTTMYEAFQRSYKKFPKNPCLGMRKIDPENPESKDDYEWLTYEHVQKRMENLGSGLRKKGFEIGQTIGLYSINRAEWIIVDVACFSYGLVTVPLYDTLGVEAMEHIMKQTELEIIILTADKIKSVLQNVERYGSIRLLVVIDQDGMNEHHGNIELISLKDLEQLGAKHPYPHHIPKPSDLLTICYTSGTTGLPKGAMLTHCNIVSDASSIILRGRLKLLAIDFEIPQVHMSYLPLAHMFERVVCACLLMGSGAIGFYAGNVLKLLDDIALLRPTFFVSVPRLLNRIYDRISAQVEKKGFISRKLFSTAISIKKANLKNGITTHWFWDRLIFNKTKEKLGNRVQVILSGAAPISGEALDFLSVVFCCTVGEGFGQTETSAGSTIFIADDNERDQVGYPMECNELKLIDIPEMNYTTKDKPYARGEVCIRGNNCFLGYYKDEEKTKDAMDAEGWIYTGDVGMFDKCGRLHIIDRKKNIFKLAQGEYVAAEKIEIIYCQASSVSQCFVYGDSLQSFLVAIIVPDEAMLMEYCTQQHIEGSLSDIIKRDDIKKFVFEEMNKIANQKDLKGFEKVQAIFLESEPFSQENGLLTPTFKLKRPQAKMYYLKHIEEMYASKK